MREFTVRITLALALIAALVGVAPSLRAEDVRYPEPPGERAFLLDEAGLVTGEDARPIVEVCTALLDEKRVPLLVVTLPSLAAYGAGDRTIERYAKSLFDAWGIGFPDWNHGILLLVARDDRKARIELGAAWGRTHDRQAQQIMDEVIVARFKEGRFSAGIVAGVRALADVARGLGPPPPPPGPRRGLPGEGKPWTSNPFWWGVILFVVSSLASIARHGRSSWGFKAWATIFMVLGLILTILSFFNARGGGSSGGGSSGGGGSFGGGFSGGGGASGSW